MVPYQKIPITMNLNEKSYKSYFTHFLIKCRIKFSAFITKKYFDRPFYLIYNVIFIMIFSLQLFFTLSFA